MDSSSSEPPPFTLSIFDSLINQNWNSAEFWVLAVIILILISLSALVSGSEIAFFSFQPDELEDFKESKSSRENLIYQLVSQPRRLLSTILIANNFFNIGIVIVSFYLLAELFDFSGQPKWLQFSIETGLITFIIVLFGEVIPKVYATQRGKRLATLMAGPLKNLSQIVKALSSLLIKSSDGLEKRLTRNHSDDGISADEVDMAIDLTTKGLVKDEEVQILKSIVRFGEIAVHDVMTSRPDIFSLSINEKFRTILRQIKDYGFSRIPIFNVDLDEIVGVLYAKDLLSYLGAPEDFDWKPLIRPPFFVPENKKIDDLLADFQSNHTHMAIVVDEYGGTSGLITLEDVLEEIIGEIKDEFDDMHDAVNYQQIAPNKYRFEGKTSLFDFCKIINAEYQLFENYKGEADSIAGLMLEMAGKFPRKNQLIKVENYAFQVKEIDAKRIKTIEIEVLP